MKKTIKKYHLKDSIKTFLIIVIIYLLFVGYLLAVAERVENLDNKEETIKQVEKNK